MCQGSMSCIDIRCVYIRTQVNVVIIIYRCNWDGLTHDADLTPKRSSLQSLLTPFLQEFRVYLLVGAMTGHCFTSQFI